MVIINVCCKTTFKFAGLNTRGMGIEFNKVAGSNANLVLPRGKPKEAETEFELGQC